MTACKTIWNLSEVQKLQAIGKDDRSEEQNNIVETFVQMQNYAQALHRKVYMLEQSIAGMPIPPIAVRLRNASKLKFKKIHFLVYIEKLTEKLKFEEVFFLEPSILFLQGISHS